MLALRAPPARSHGCAAAPPLLPTPPAPSVPPAGLNVSVPVRRNPKKLSPGNAPEDAIQRLPMPGTGFRKGA